MMRWRLASNIRQWIILKHIFFMTGPIFWGGGKSIKGEINLVPYEMPGELKGALKAFIEYYNYQRYHEGLGDVTPYDVLYTGRHHEVIQTRKEAKNRTLQARRDCNRTIREQGSAL